MTRDETDSPGDLGQPPPPCPRPNTARPPSAARGRRFVVGVSGASGAAYSLRLLELLVGAGAEVHLVVTTFGRRLLAEEAGIRGLAPADLLPAPLAEAVATGSAEAGRLIVHPSQDVGAVIASGSFLHEGMVILPCSSASLGAIATGGGDNLLTRAAAVTLKERRPLIVCHRETPLTLMDIENYRTIALAGGIICPTNPGLYLQPRRIEDLIDFMAGKVLDLLAVEHTLATRWDGVARARSESSRSGRGSS